MNNQYLVSVIFPVFNCEKYLNRSITSVLNQTYEKFKIFACDDGSSDRSWKIIEGFEDARIIKFRNPQNIGNLKTVNFLLGKADGDFITFLDADDWIHPQKFEKQIRFLLENPDIAFCGTNYTKTDENENEIFCSNFPKYNNDILKACSIDGVPPFCFASVMMRNKVYKTIGGFRSYFNRIGAADYDWILRVMEKYSVGNLQEILYFYRHNPASYSQEVTMDLRKRFSEEIAFFLAKQRSVSGSDALTNSDKMLELEYFLQELSKPYQDDPPKIYREKALAEIKAKKFFNSIISIGWAFIRNPLSKQNRSILNYWIGKFFFRH